MSSAKDLVVFGSFGFGNIGDEAIPYAVSDLAAMTGQERNISIVSRYDTPRMESVIGLGKSYQNEHSMLENKDIIISGGGIIEPKDISCVARFEQYCKQIKPGRSSIVAGSFEFGVEYSRRFKRRFNKLFSRMEHIYTRDYISEIFFRETFPDFPVSTTGDLVLAMKANEHRPEEVQVDKDNYIAVCLSGTWKNSPQWRSWITQELIDISNDLDKPLLFTPMSCDGYDNDRIEHQEIINLLKSQKIKHAPLSIEEELDPRDVAAIFRDASLVIAMRLHSCVMAYAQKTPFIGISYHPKLVGFAQTVGWRHFLLPGKNLPLTQDKGKYGYDFSSLNLEKGELYRKSMEALEHGSFNLLPLLVNNLKQVIAEI